MNEPAAEAQIRHSRPVGPMRTVDSAHHRARRADGPIRSEVTPRRRRVGLLELRDRRTAAPVAHTSSGCSVKRPPSSPSRGRALWGDAARAPANERATVLAELVRPRLARLVAIHETAPVT